MKFTTTEGDYLIILIALLSPVALFVPRRRIRALGLFGVAATLLFAALPMGEIGRFFLITTPASAALTAWMLDRLSRGVRFPGAIRVAAGIFALAVLVQHQVLFFSAEMIRWHGQPLMTPRAANAFIQTRMRGFESVIPAYEWMDQNLPENVRVLCINHHHVLYMPRPFWARGRWNIEVYDWLLERLGSTEAVTNRLRDEGITHVFRQGEPMIDPSYWEWERRNTDRLWQEGDVSVRALRVTPRE
jgi:hypothetical protein